jgi:uncharacterized protein
MLTESTGDVLLTVRVKPRASSTRLAGTRQDRLLIEVTAPPVDRKANDAVCRLVAKTLGIATGRVTIAGGERARDKLLRIEALSAREVAAKLRLQEDRET